MRGYDSSMRGTLDQAGSGGMASAIRVLDAANPGPFKDLLYHLELGMLLRLDGRYEESQKSWKTAAESVQPAEQSIEDDVVNLLKGASSYVVNDRLRAYPGYDYEKVMLLTHIALNYLAMGDFDQARVAIKQTHELEALIAEARSKEIAEVEEKAKKRGARTSFKELNGYRSRRSTTGGQRAEEQLPERALALSRRLRLRGARRAGPRGARLPAGERTPAQPAAARRGAARPRPARRRLPAMA